MKYLLSGIAVTFAATGAAQAATLSAADLLNNYAVITKGDYTSNIEVEGNVYIGGDTSGSVNFDQGTFGDPEPNLADVVVLGTNQNQLKAKAGSSTVYIENNQGFVENADTVFFGTNTGTIQGVGSTVNATPDSSILLDSNDVFATLDAASDDLQALTATSSFVEFDQGYTIGSGVHLVDFSALVKTEINFDLADGETAIINVSGSDVTSHLKFENNDAEVADQVIWNFFEADTVTLWGSKFSGSILAPDAFVTGFNGSTEGSVYANSVSQTSGEVHARGFIGTLPETGTLTPVPLPAGLPLMLAGLGAFGFMARRRRS